MKNLAMDFVDEFYDLRRNIEFAMQIPHQDLTVKEQELLKEINEIIDDYAYEARDTSSYDLMELDQGPKFLHLSVAEWVKYAVRDMDEKARSKAWKQLRYVFRSYGITYGGFLKEVRRLGVPFTGFYEDQFDKHILGALRTTYSRLNGLINYYESLQYKFGEFQYLD
jgi:hypothetical protein